MTLPPDRMDPTEHLAILARAPRLGTVKTRLAAALGDRAALDIYRRLLQVLAGRLAPLGPVCWRVTPDDATAELDPWLHPGWRARPQGGGSLDARISRAFDDAFAAGARRVVVIGSDCPDVTADDITGAWRLLGDHDVVLGPAVDGGFWAIGLAAPRPGMLAGIPWSTPGVWAATTERVRSAGLRHACLRTLGDIDTPADWEAWQRRAG